MESKRIFRKSIRYNEDIKNRVVDLYKYIHEIDENIIITFSEVEKSGVIRMAIDLIYNNEHLINNETNTNYFYLSDLYIKNNCSYNSFIWKITEEYLEVPIKVVWDYGNIFISRKVKTDVDDDYIVFELSIEDKFTLAIQRIDNITQVEIVEGSEVEYALENKVENVSYLKIYLK